MRYLFLAKNSSEDATASHYYEKAAIFLFWRNDLYEKAGILEKHDPARAINLLQKSRNRGSLSPAGQLYLGDAYQSSAQTGLAIAEWETLYQNSQELTRVCPRLATIYHAQAQFIHEMDILKKWLSLEPQNPDANQSMGILLAADAKKEAVEYLQRTADQSATSALRLRRLISALSDSNEDEAYRLTRSAQALADLGEWTLAEQALGKAIEKNNRYASAWAMLGLVKQHANAEDAPDLIDTALQMEPDSAAIHAIAGTYWAQAHQLEKARGEFLTATQIEPENPAWWSAYAGVASYYDLTAALEAYIHAINLAPDESIYQYQLALFCLENNAYIEEYGLKAALKAYALEPANPAYLDVLGRAQMATGQMEAAELIFKKALELIPKQENDYIIHFHLGLLYLQTNQKHAARDELEYTITHDPHGAYGTQAKNIVNRYFP